MVKKASTVPNPRVVVAVAAADAGGAQHLATQPTLDRTRGGGDRAAVRRHSTTEIVILRSFSVVRVRVRVRGDGGERSLT
jgi:hypothetical protein